MSKILKQDNAINKDEKIEEKSLTFASAVSLDPSWDMLWKRVNVNIFYQTYRQNADVYWCVREIYQNVWKKWYSWLDYNWDKIVNNISEELNFILNRFENFRNLKRETIKDKKISWNAYWYLVRNFAGNRIVWVKRIDPRMMAIVLDKFWNIIKYIQYSWWNQFETVIYEPNEIIHFTWEKDSNFPMFWLSPIEPMFWEVQTDIKAVTSNHAFFENMAMPAVQYLLDDKINKEQAAEIIKSIKENFWWPENRHKSWAFQWIKEIKTISQNKQEMDFLNWRAFATEKVCATFWVPKFMLWYTDKVNNNNWDNLTLNFIENTIIPEEIEFEDIINRDFIYKLWLEWAWIKFKFNEQNTQNSSVVEERARKEYEQWILTLRQYKEKTKQNISELDEKNPLIDKHLIINWSSVILSENIGKVENTENLQ